MYVQKLRLKPSSAAYECAGGRDTVVDFLDLEVADILDLQLADFLDLVAQVADILDLVVDFFASGRMLFGI